MDSARALIQLVAQQLVARDSDCPSTPATPPWFTFAAMLVHPPRGAGRGSDRIGGSGGGDGRIVSTARSALLGCGVGLVLGMALAWLRNRVDRRAMVLSGVAMIAVGVLLTLAPGSSMNRGVQEAFQAVNASDGGGVEAYPDQVRPLWWRIGFDAFTAAPVAGQGLGSAKTMIEGDAEVLEITRDGTVNQHAIRDDYHSLFVTVAADGGLSVCCWWHGSSCWAASCCQGGLDAVLLGARVVLVFSVLNTTAFSGRRWRFRLSHGIQHPIGSPTGRGRGGHGGDDMTDRILLSPPHMSGEERRLVERVFDSNWIAPVGPAIDAFERELEQCTGANHACALSSGTAAIHLALRLLGVEPGDLVLCSSLTFVASANPILMCGAEPVFVDSDPDSWHVDGRARASPTSSPGGSHPGACVGLSVRPVRGLPGSANSAGNGVRLLDEAAEAPGHPATAWLDPGTSGSILQRQQDHHHLEEALVGDDPDQERAQFRPPGPTLGQRLRAPTPSTTA